jgi:hypothetical protein
MVDSAVVDVLRCPCRILSPRCRTSALDVRVLPGAPEVQGRAPPRAGSADGAGGGKVGCARGRESWELSEAASAAVWRHAPGLENGFACGGGDGSGRGGRGELPPGGAANDAHGEDGSDASSADECNGESAGSESRSRVRRPLLACVSDVLVERDRLSRIVEALSAGPGLSSIDLQSNYRSSTCDASPSAESGAEAMLISTAASREVRRELTLETLTAFLVPL